MGILFMSRIVDKNWKVIILSFEFHISRLLGMFMILINFIAKYYVSIWSENQYNLFGHYNDS